MKYAAETKVDAGRSRAEIERTLQRYGATGFMYGWQGRRAMIGFEMDGKRIQFELEMPDPDGREFTHTPGRGQRRSMAQQASEYEKATRQRWRALALVIKAKLEAIESGIATFEQEFLAYIALPNGQTVGQFMLPQIQRAYKDGQMPALLPAGRDASDR